MLALTELIAALLCAILAALGLMMLTFRRSDGSLPVATANSGAAIILAAIIGAIMIAVTDIQIRQEIERAQTQQMITDLDNTIKGY